MPMSALMTPPMRVRLCALILAAGLGMIHAPALVAEQTRGRVVWTPLFNGKTLAGWNQTGESNWHVSDGMAVATTGTGMLVAGKPYKDFDLVAEMWVSAGANSGIFFRGDDAVNVTPDTAYELNLFDARPDPLYRTGAIVGISSPLRRVDAGEHWNIVELSVRGPHIIAKINGVITVDTTDTRRDRSGVLALQCSNGTVMIRRVDIRVPPTQAPRR